MDPNVRWLGFGAVVRAGGMTLVAPYVVLYLRNVLHLGYAEIGLLVALTGVVPLLIVPFAGLLTDRIGRRRVFLVALVAEALAVLFVAAAMQERWLLGMVVSTSLVYTVGTIAGPALSAYVADFSVGSERTLAFTWVRIGWNVGFTLGVLAGGSLIGFIGFPDVGFLAGAVLLVSTTFLAVVLRPSPYDLARGAARRCPRPIDRRPRAFGRAPGYLMRDRVFLAFCAAVAVAQPFDHAVGLDVSAVCERGPRHPLLAHRGRARDQRTVGGLRPGPHHESGDRPSSHLAVRARDGALRGGFLVLAGFAFAGVAIVAGFFLSIVVLTTGENLTSIPANTLPSNLAPPTEVGAYNGAFFAIVGVGQLLAQPLGGFVLALGANPLLTWGILVVPALPAMLWLGGFIAPRVNPRREPRLTPAAVT